MNGQSRYKPLARTSIDDIRSYDELQQDEKGEEPTTIRASTGRNDRWPSLMLFFVLGGCIGAFIVGLWFNLHPPQSGFAGCRTYPESPAYDIVRNRHSVHKPAVHIGPDNPYSGAPNEMSNRAWSALLRGYNIRVPISSTPKNQPPSIPIADGSNDIWASLGVYHHLHCLDSLRHELDGRDCKSRDATSDEDGFSVHLDHCIDSMRQWFMCQPDLSLRSTYWREDGLSVAANNSISHECVDWDALQVWVESHTIGSDDRVIRMPDGNLFGYVNPPAPRCAAERKTT